MFTQKDIPSQKGKIIVVTGANTGIGYETALALYQAGAHVVLACRSEEKAGATVKKLELAGGTGTLETGVLDLADLASVEKFADDFLEKHQTLDVLINNAGVMVPPPTYTQDGFELQTGVNFLGHFALTGKLCDLLSKTQGSRIVMLSSLVANNGVIDIHNFKMEKPYNAQREYAMSKLACLMFAIEMQYRITASKDSIIVTAAHPGGTYTDLSRNLTEEEFKSMVDTYGEMMPAWQGALPIIYAAVSADVTEGGYYGPDGGLRGYPVQIEPPEHAKDAAIAKLLWEKAEALTGVYFL